MSTLSFLPGGEPREDFTCKVESKPFPFCGPVTEADDDEVVLLALLADDEVVLLALLACVK